MQSLAQQWESALTGRPSLPGLRSAQAEVRAWQGRADWALRWLDAGVWGPACWLGWAVCGVWPVSGPCTAHARGACGP
ncbi:hypothetical protein ACFP81_09735 [Deinococcus lacus]|uniref:Uncharacterized protein n=1 Tax=Deinococcus lacus TaxID=392561 RepID=A0ABW1YHA8_9DEIO